MTDDGDSSAEDEETEEAKADEEADATEEEATEETEQGGEQDSGEAEGEAGSEEAEGEEIEEEEDSSTRDELDELGFYDNEFTEFPPELSGVKRFKANDEAEPLVEALQLPGYDVTFMRLEMIEALGRIGDPVAVDVLEGELRDGDTQIEAMEALGRIGSPEAVDSLTDLLDPEKRVKPHVRAKAAETLGEIASADGVEALADVLEVESPRVRGAAARALGRVGEPSEDAVEALANLLEDDPEEHVRVAAAKALDALDTDAAEEALSDYRDDRNELVAKAAQ